MAKETGHYKNVTNANRLIEHIKTFKKDYVPSKESITYESLANHYLKSLDVIAEVQNEKNNWSSRVDDRQLGFKDVRKKATRIIGILSGTNLSPKKIETAKSINAKIQGVRLIKPKKGDLEKEINEPEKQKHSISRLSYDSTFENISDLIDLLAQSPGYDPNNHEFKVTELQDYAKNLAELTKTMDKAVATTAEARRKRQQLLYTESIGLVDTMLDAKEYIKGVYGASSPEFITANKINFRNFK